VKTVYNHIDLDHVAEASTTSPRRRQNRRRKSTRPRTPIAALENWPPYREWREREALWQPRTYRALLDGQKYTPIVIEDPKTKAVRELLPFKEAQRCSRRSASTCRATTTASGRRRAAAATAAPSRASPRPPRQSRRHRRAKSNSSRRSAPPVVERILTQIRAKHDGALGVAELATWARARSTICRKVSVFLLKAFGLKDPGWSGPRRWRSSRARTCPSSSRSPSSAEACSTATAGRRKIAKQVCERFKIDRKAIEKTVRAELTAKPEGETKAQLQGQGQGEEEVQAACRHRPAARWT
jgi:hypothetical protein